MDELKKELEKLKFIATGSNEGIIEFVKELVPTYKSAEEVVAAEENR